MSFANGRRATNLAEMQAIRDRFDNRAGRAQGLRYRPAPSDVFIATYPKCGTTWLQQMLHTLRTGGDTAFDEITEVVPWLEMAAVMDIDPRAPQRARPKVFKTHLPYHEIPKGSRYVHMLRDPADVAVSMYHFHAGWFFEPEAIGLNEYVTHTFLSGGGRANYWQFVASWWPRRADPQVLYLIYEEALRSPRATIARIAEFMGVQADANLLDLTEERAGIDYMRAHERQFDDHIVRTLMNRDHRLPADSASTKVRTGRTGEGRERLDEQTRARLELAWRDSLQAAFGLASYRALTEQLAREREPDKTTSTPDTRE